MPPENPTSALELILTHVQAFIAAIGAIQDVDEFVTESGANLNSVERSIAREGHRLYPGVDPEIHAQVAAYLHPMIHKRMQLRRELERKHARKDAIEAMSKKWATELRNGIASITGDPQDYYRYSTVWDRARFGYNRSSIIRRSLLIAATSDFEVLVSGLVRSFLTLKPDLLRASEKEYSFREIDLFANLDEFRAHCADVMAEALLRGGFEDWMEFFSKRHGVTAAGVTDGADVVIEIFQRRHLLVHNGGVVNRYYVAKVGTGDKNKIGNKLEIDSKYLSNALNSLTAAGVKLAFALSLKLTPKSDKEHVDHRLARVGYEMLAAGSWQVVADLCDWHLTFCHDEETKLIVEINRWTALKNLHDPEYIKSAVENWKTNSLAAKFRLARFALLDLNEEAYGLAKKLLADGDLEHGDWRNWPVLQGVRAYENESVDEAEKISLPKFEGHDEHS